MSQVWDGDSELEIEIGFINGLDMRIREMQVF